MNFRRLGIHVRPDNQEGIQIYENNVWKLRVLKPLLHDKDIKFIASSTVIEELASLRTEYVFVL